MIHSYVRPGQVPSLILALSFALFVAACGGDSDDTSASPVASPSSPAATSAATRPPATAAASTPAISPSAVAALEARIAQAYRDNRTFMTRATVDELKVTFNPSTGLATINLRPLPTSTNTIGGGSFLGGAANDTLAITSHSSVVAGKAIWASFPEVKRVYVVVSTEFTLNNGNKVIEPAASISVDRATGEKANFDTLKTTVAADSKSFFCQADAYRFHVAIYPAITDKGCLTGISKGVSP